MVCVPLAPPVLTSVPDDIQPVSLVRLAGDAQPVWQFPNQTKTEAFMAHVHTTIMYDTVGRLVCLLSLPDDTLVPIDRKSPPPLRTRLGKKSVFIKTYKTLSDDNKQQVNWLLNHLSTTIQACRWWGHPSAYTWGRELRGLTKALSLPSGLDDNTYTLQLGIESGDCLSAFKLVRRIEKSGGQLIAILDDLLAKYDPNDYKAFTDYVKVLPHKKRPKSSVMQPLLSVKEIIDLVDETKYFLADVNGLDITNWGDQLKELAHKIKDQFYDYEPAFQWAHSQLDLLVSQGSKQAAFEQKRWHAYLTQNLVITEMGPRDGDMNLHHARLLG